MGTNGERRPYKRWPEALKREVVAASLAPGASVSVVARQYDVNANQVFCWRRRYREVSEPSSSAESTSGFVPVTITAEPETNSGAASPASVVPDTIEIAVCDTYRVRVGSHFDGVALRRVLDVLGRVARGRGR